MGGDRDENFDVAQRQVHADGGTAYRPSPQQQQREDAMRAIEQYASTGKGDAAQLPQWAAIVDYPLAVRPKLPAIAKRTSGDIVLECARVVHEGLADSLQLAFEAKSPPTASKLRRFLQDQWPATLFELEHHETLIAKLRAIFREPLTDLIPTLGTYMDSWVGLRRLMKWYVDTTDPTVAGLALAARGSAALAETLDAIDGWSWLDTFQLSASEKYGNALSRLRDATKNPRAKTKLDAMVKAFTEDDDARGREAFNAVIELPAQLAKRDTPALIQTAARTQERTQGDHTDVVRRLRGESGDTVLEFVVATWQDIQTAVELFDGAKGPRAEHLREVLRMRASLEVVDALTRDPTRQAVRRIVGRGVSLLALFPSTAHETIHGPIVKDAALRNWVYEDDHPETLLWLAAGSGASAKDGSRLVKRERGNGWVIKLPPGADEPSLRRFALASNDPRAVTYVRERLLRDPEAQKVDPGEHEVVPAERIVYGAGAKARLNSATNEVGEDPATAIERLADLDGSERAEVLRDPKQMSALLDDVEGASMVRAMYLLRPTMMQLLVLPFPKGAEVSSLLSYVQTRPAAEGLAVAKSEAMIRAARRLFPGYSPFDVVTALRDEKVLAKALVDNIDLFEWILEDTEPSHALAMLAREGVRQIAATMMGERQEIAENLPEFQDLLGEGKRGYKTLHERMDKKWKAESQAYLDGDAPSDSTVDIHAQALKRAAKQADLAAAIEELAKSGGDRGGFMSLVRRAPAAQQISILDGSHPDALSTLRRVTGMMPQQLFPDLSPAQLFALRGAARWLLLWEAPTVILAMLHNQPAAQQAIARSIDDDPSVLGAFPRGGELMPHERQVLDGISRHVTTGVAIKSLFEARFDVAIENFDIEETRRIWKVVARLPPAQFNQRAVAKVIETSIGPIGQWASPNIELDSASERFAGNDTLYDEQQTMSLAEVKALYGLTDTDVEIATNDGWLVEEQGKYRVAGEPGGLDQLTSTMLHEVGHSIDELLGQRTDLVFGIGGWKGYGLGQLDEWIDDMNGFDGIRNEDRPRVLDAWSESLRSERPVKQLVGPDHPAMDGTAPIVEVAQQGKTLRYSDPDKVVYADRVCVRNGLALYSMPKQTYLSAPSQYALAAPPEYFAECYVEYYRNYDGTPSTESKKGGLLPPWIKNWFDANVDRIRLNPTRVRAQKP